MKKLFIIIFLLYSSISISQTFSNQRLKTIYNNNDTIKLDSLVIIPPSVKLKDNFGNEISKDKYFVDYFNSLIFIKDSSIQKAQISYKVYNINISKVYCNKDTSIIVDKLQDFNEDNLYTVENENQFEIISSNTLEKEGNISRGITFGNNQDFALNSNLDLQLNGKINDELSVNASITDNTIPIQAEGNTQQIQDFDNVFIQIYSDKSALTVGDFQSLNSESNFLNYNKKVKGANYSYKNENTDLTKLQLTDFSFGTAIGKGSYNRMTIDGIEANQGPYKLSGKSGESYIIVLSGSERVFVDGMLKTRGENNDYTIDYNSAELTFTTNFPITKDSRIIVEFEYSEQNYSRFLFFNSTKVANQNNEFSLNIYSGADSKNQPLQYEFTEEQKQQLNSIGDNIESAISQRIDSVEFSADYILYIKKDTVVENVIYNDVFEYNPENENSHFRLTFSDVGNNNGNYIEVISNANGRVYEWVAPVNGIKQGKYEPVVLLITPKKKQVFNFTGKNILSEKTELNYEIAVSKNDVNTFSNIDKNNDLGYALNLNAENYFIGKLNSDKYIKLNVDYTYTDYKFTFLEYSKAPEFNRNWNLDNEISTASENLINSNLQFYNKNIGKLSYSFSTLQYKNNYAGYNNKIETEIDLKKTSLYQNSSLITTKDKIFNTLYVKNYTELSQNISFLTLGISSENEYNNRTYSDSLILSANSFKFDELSFYIENNDTTNNTFLGKYIYRNDYFADNNKFVKATTSNDYVIKYENNPDKANNFSISVNYRELRITDTLLTNDEPVKNLIGNFGHNLKLYKNAITSGLQFEVGSGLEQKKEYLFVEVNQGQGLYKWIDYNSNSLKELDEFEVANYTDEANYIRIFKQSANYIKTYNNKFSFLLSLNPKKIWSDKKGIKKLCTYFTDNISFKIEQSTLVPMFPLSKEFIINNEDIVSSTEYFRNLLTINKSGIVSLDYIVNKQANKILLINGIDFKKTDYQNIVLYLNIQDSYLFSNSTNKGVNNYNSEYLTSKDYSIDFIENDFKFNYQLNNQFEISVFYIFSKKNNTMDIEKSEVHNLGSEANYNILSETNLLFSFNYYKINFIGDLNSSISYIMLESLKPGNNFTWSVNLQKTIFTNLQIDLLYEGRFSEDEKIIHSGNVQIRALF